MRTKTLLIAAAALAAGVLASSATTYSLNIVGYINQVLPAGANTLICNQLQTTNATASAEAVLPALQVGDSLLIWDAGIGNYDTYTYVGGGSTGWVQPDGMTMGGPPNISLGQGFYYYTGSLSQETNTFVGTVITNGIVSLPAGANTLVGSIAPIAATADSTNMALPLQVGDSLLLWDAGIGNYDTYTYVGGGSTGWVQPDGATMGGPPTIQVGQGFYYYTGSLSAETWTQNIQVN
jgi:hypothetical protein